MTRFMDRMVDASEQIAGIRATLRAHFPQFADIEIPSRLTNSVTLSTMHGCPPDEIERIAQYLINDRVLHTIVKLNPTLLGKHDVLHILHDELGFCDIRIPDRVFEHDLQYGRAVQLIHTLKQAASERGLTFGVKLSNTLAMANHKGTLPGDEMYMSGRALYPITIHLFRKLVQEFAGDLNVSFSAGADSCNVATILAAGARPVTAATDLLKPGGYSRLLQYLETLEQAMHDQNVHTLEELTSDRLANLERAAGEALHDPRYKKSYHPYGMPKVQSGLEPFDCIVAPCVEQCAIRQDVPDYAWWIAQGDFDKAVGTILSRNPLPAVTGYVCTHLCQTRCTRNNYDEPVTIRALKRFAMAKGQATVAAKTTGAHKVAVIGAGPSGLAAAYFLALNGVQVTIFEAQSGPGGMLRVAPAFRLPLAIVQQDVDRITSMGVEIKLSHPITTPPEELLKQGFDAVYVACGFPKDAPLNVTGVDTPGVLAALDLLERTACGERVALGPKVLVIGGGNTAIDAARTAQRIAGQPVTVVYRRTQHEMPATEEEKDALFTEGGVLIELASPTRILARDGRLVALECIRNKLGEPGADGRRQPIPIEDSEFRIEADSIIVAVGQRSEVAFLDGSAVSLRKNGAIEIDGATGQTTSSNVYAGGDAVRGPAIVVEACADGRRAAEAICRKLGIRFAQGPSHAAAVGEAALVDVKQARARRAAPHAPEMLPLSQRSSFDLVEKTLSEVAARSEAARCLQCSTLCDKCVEVCPNRANYAYLAPTVDVMMPKLSCQNGRLEVCGEDRFHIAQTRQIIHVDDLCNECGNCATFCVHEGEPYRDKPRLFLSHSDFSSEGDNAYHVEKSQQGWTIRRRNGGEEFSLSQPGDGSEMTFESDWLRVTLAAPDFRVRTMRLLREFSGEFSMVAAAEMHLILNGVVQTLPFLPFGHTRRRQAPS
jgi:putative selenate reductase